LKRVNPKVQGLPNAMSDDEMLRTAKLLAKLAEGENFIPKGFSRDIAEPVLRAAVWTTSLKADPIKRLVENGVLIERAQGAAFYFRFVLDPVAEFLAADAYYDEYGNKAACWEELKQRSAGAPGFQAAVLLIRQAREIGEASHRHHGRDFG
jgi:hypothetical protein